MARASARVAGLGKMRHLHPSSAKPSGLPRDSRRSQRVAGSAAGPCQKRTLPFLNPRVREVLSWLAQGRTNQTNRQIGMALMVSSRTIEKHVERILAKLGRPTARLPL
jgi:DNA-binding CsgD family transcriptional regulator